MAEIIQPVSSEGARRDAWIAAGAYLACGVAWLVLEISAGMFAHPGTARLMASLFVVVNGPALIVLIYPGRASLILLLAFAASMAVLWLVLAVTARARGLGLGPVSFVFPIAFLGLAFLAWRAANAYARPRSAA